MRHTPYTVQTMCVDMSHRAIEKVSLYLYRAYMHVCYTSRK